MPIVETRRQKSIVNWTQGVGCLLGLAVVRATARLSTRTGLVSWTELGTNLAWVAKIRSGA